MGFSNQSIKPVKLDKPHICKREGLWRVSPFAWKNENVKRHGRRWELAHAYTNAQNELIRAEFEAAKERQREWKRAANNRTCNFCGSLAEYTHRDGSPVCKCSNKECTPGRDRWLEYEDFEELGK